MNRTVDDKKLLATAGTEARRNSFGPGGGIGIPVERSDKFGETLRRLGELLGKEKPRLVGVLVATVLSVTLMVIGPKLLGEATNIIVDGFTSQDGIDFDALHRQLFIVAGVYVASWILSYTQAYVLAGVVQRSMFALRQFDAQHLDLVGQQSPTTRIGRFTRFPRHAGRHKGQTRERPGRDIRHLLSSV